MSGAVDPRGFFTERVPGQWNRALEAQPRASEAERRVYEGMRAVDATIRVEVRGEGGGGWYLNVREGRMSAGDDADREPFLTLIQDREGFERLAREAGDSALALLGGLSGLAGELVLTRARLDGLASLRGLLQFEVSGERGFRLLTHFGPGPVPEEPTTRITLDEEGYRALRAGALDPPSAFLEGRIDVQGDLQLAMQLAVAASLE